MLYVSEKYNTPEFVVTDGNNGVNLRIENIGFPTSVTVWATFTATHCVEEQRLPEKETE